MSKAAAELVMRLMYVILYFFIWNDIVGFIDDRWIQMINEKLNTLCNRICCIKLHQLKSATQGTMLWNILAWLKKIIAKSIAIDSDAFEA